MFLPLLMRNDQSILVLFQTSDLDDSSPRDSQEVSRVPCLLFTFLWDGFMFLTCAQLPRYQQFSMAHFSQKVQRQQDSDRTSLCPEVLSVGHSYDISQQDLLSLSKSREFNYF